jgi:hypothetical protein
MPTVNYADIVALIEKHKKLGDYYYFFKFNNNFLFEYNSEIKNIKYK